MENHFIFHHLIQKLFHQKDIVFHLFFVEDLGAWYSSHTLYSCPSAWKKTHIFLLNRNIIFNLFYSLTLVIFFACFIRNSNDDEEMIKHIDNNKHWNLILKEKFFHLNRDRFNQFNKVQLKEVRQQCLKEIKIWSIIYHVYIFY